MILLNPGPTNTSEKIKIAQNKNTDMCHRTSDFYYILRKTKDNLLNIFGNNTDFNISILAGSGTTALESMITSLVNEKVTIINAGKYGQRAVDICKIYNIDHNIIDSNNIRDLEKNNKVKLLYFVENETSTGENYSPIEIMDLYPNAKFLIDATSSFGASNYNKLFDRIKAISFCANKCLQSVPGLGIVIYKKNAKLVERTYQTSLKKYISDIPFTLPVQSISGLHEATKDNKNNFILFNNRRDLLIKEFKKLNIECLNYNPCNSIIAFRHPSKDYETLNNFCLKNNIVIYGNVKDDNYSFRISTMSYIFDQKFDYIKKVFYDSCIH